MKQSIPVEKLFPASINFKKSMIILANPQLWLLLTLIILTSIFYHYDFLSFNHRLDLIWQIRLTEYIYHINGIFIYLSFIFAAVTFGWIASLFVWGLSFLIILPRIIFYTNSFPSLFNNILILVVPVITLSCFVLIIKWIRREKQIFADSELERQIYMLEVLKAQENERKYVAHEIHDSTIQTLFVLSNNIQDLLDNNENNLSKTIFKQIESFRDTAALASEDLRRLCIKLRPSVLDNIGLIEALRWLVDNTNGKNIKTQLVIEGIPPNMCSDTEVMVFRFVQEAISNVKRHSHATRATVSLTFTADMAKVAIVDNGTGFELPKPVSKLALESKLGLLGMQERAKSINGTFEIYSRPGSGTSVSLEFKL